MKFRSGAELAMKSRVQGNADIAFKLSPRLSVLDGFSNSLKFNAVSEWWEEYIAYATSIPPLSRPH